MRRYATWDEVLDYCRRSANPVGRLVLRIAGYRDAALDAASDALCTALQLTNFWQDLAIDWRRGRLYVPESERDAAGAREADLDRGHLTAEWRTALGRAAARHPRGCSPKGGRCATASADAFATSSAAPGSARRASSIGSRRSGFDVFRARPALGAADAAVLAARVVLWRPSARHAGR